YYKFQDDKLATRGPYRLQPLATNSMDERENLRYAILYKENEIWPEKQWQWAKKRVTAALENDELVIKKVKGKWSVNYKQYLRNDKGEERRSKMYSIIEGIYTQHGTGEIKELLGDGKVFAFPKPSELVKAFIQLASSDDDIILDSFAGSGTTGHAVHATNKEDGGQRQFILVEMEEHIAESITQKRVKKVIEREAPTESHEVNSGGFRFCRLGPSLLDAGGNVADEIKFADLARHVWFCETGEPWPKAGTGRHTPLLGTHNDTAIYLLFNGVLGDRRVNGGNVLTGKVLDSLKKQDGPKVIYGEASRLGKDRLKREGITFKQIPYEVKGV
ncbi:MAG: DNA methyltransferase, partial [Planctomycetota bacterium]